MRPDDNSQVHRRTFVLAAGASAASIGLAGCLGGGGGGDGSSDDGNSDGSSSDGGDEGGQSDGGGAGDWEGVDEIRLEGVTQNWVGVSPAPIEDEENPTLVLTEGQEYDVTWENGDGVPHNIEFRNADGEVIEGTETMGEQGQTQTLTIEATSEMVEYVCNPHETMMVGDVEVQ